MINTLQRLFPSLLTQFPNDRNKTKQYVWFLTTDQLPIGIHKKELTQKDNTLLATFLTPFNANLPTPTVEEDKWRKRISGANQNEPNETKATFRFIYFQLADNEVDPTAFLEAIQALFSKSVPILWENEHEGVIIEEKSVSDEDINFKQIINVLTSDLYVNIKFFIGLYQRSLHNVSTYYNTMKATAKTVFAHSKLTVITYPEAVPYILMNQVNTSVREQITSGILDEFVADPNMLQTIQTFFKCNLNVSVTAKEMYMHRNSLQYRIDKFRLKTGIDIQQFDQAQAVYLALLAKEFEKVSEHA
ncbi:PucR family transcriptional regulator [Virgibacillus sp. W0430]|uniref:PucR family transcriptional regulator n=1 Tax=Virgibacillus sp. W0430 TaxID=3391580 RepID=UPI003F48AB4C